MVIGAFAHWLGKLWATRLIQDEKQKLDLEIESYRVRLKKSEFIFQKEFEAASELVSLIRTYLPSYDAPWMDWHDVCDHIASQLDRIESDIDTYISKHGAITREDVLKHLLEASSKAGTSKFEVTGPEPPASANRAAEEILNALRAAEKILVDKVHDQSST
ncbi:hypothetical protein LGV61_10945 [Desulfurispirillum indicum]|uniref:hypothetical protein n=1 Tax=Desulfurispirillum indicum TaxID=936456 RepID=UPI001CFC45D7|nr:hypothetical protein [Desulfurispirillum indicum]UCZ56232.1 hypothetical protein LGV61_10945 [Desulfurispirillum indicum]